MLGKFSGAFIFAAFIGCLVSTGPANANEVHMDVSNKFLVNDLLGFFHNNIINIASSVFNAFFNIWHYPIFITVDKQPITIANITIGLILFVLGLKFAKYLSELTSRRLFRILNIDPTVKGILEKIFHYVFIILITLIVLDISHVPLTVFTLVGGALAISLGLGSQNILNNFISGLIIMIEQPIRVGDVVDINNTIGRVINIGARCVNLRTANNIDILIPNSNILQNPVVNWTLNDENIRVSTVIPIALDAPTKMVEELLYLVLEQNNNILNTPKPEVMFQSISEGALKFELFFWINVNSNIERRRILSEIHHSVAALFKEHNITLAIYSRDLYMG